MWHIREGFSPHQKMSFAAPLSVGVLSKGEYFDMEVNSTLSTKEAIERINEQNVEGVKVLSYKLLPDNAKNAMAVMSAADYFVYTDIFTDDDITGFINQDSINVIKKTKKSEKEVDIKPLIYSIKKEDNGIFIKLAQGSAQNLKPELVVTALENFTQKSDTSYIYERLDMYCTEDGKLISLDNIGSDIGENIG